MVLSARSRLARVKSVLPLVAVACVAAACGGGGSDNDPPPRESVPHKITSSSSHPAGSIGTRQVPELGTVLAGSDGRTVYLFEKDTESASTCYDDCAVTWPPVLISGAPVAGSGVDPAKLGTTERRDGGMQLMYNDHPLYYYAGDDRPGQTAGQDMESFGAEWYSVSPAGTKVE